MKMSWLLGKAQSAPERATLELFPVQWAPGHTSYEVLDIPKLSIHVATEPGGASLVVKQGGDSILTITLPLPKESNVVEMKAFSMKHPAPTKTLTQ